MVKRCALALVLLTAGCNLSYDNSCFTCNGNTACPSGLSCIEGYCQKAAGQCGSTSGTGTGTGTATSGGTTSGGTTTTGGNTTTTGGTTGSSICTIPPSGLCPPNADTSMVSCDLGCCPASDPYSCYATGSCYASADQAAADCADAGLGCSTCESSWCGSPSDIQSCSTAGDLYCGNGNCCPPSKPWYCAGTNLCYDTQALALGDCSNSCSYCTPPCVDATSNTSCSGAGMLSCGNACCDPSTPYYCAVNAGAGYCFVSNAEAYQYCQGSGIGCVTCVP